MCWHASKFGCPLQCYDDMKQRSAYGIAVRKSFVSEPSITLRRTPLQSEVVEMAYHGG